VVMVAGVAVTLRWRFRTSDLILFGHGLARSIWQRTTAFAIALFFGFGAFLITIDQFRFAEAVFALSGLWAWLWLWLQPTGF
jgi:hypothetical protein